MSHYKSVKTEHCYICLTTVKCQIFSISDQRNRLSVIILALFIVGVLFYHLASAPLSPCSLMETELTSLCQSVLEDFNLVMFYLPPPTHGAAHQCPSEEEDEQQPQHADSSCPVLPDTLVFKMVVTCLMVVHSLKRGG